MLNLYTAIVLITIFLLIITMTDAATNRLITREMKKWALISCMLIAVSTLCECIGVLTNGAAANYITLHRLAKLTEFAFAPAIGVAVAIAFGAAKFSKAALTVVAAQAVFQCAAMPFGLVFSIDAQNIYHRESLYSIYVISFVFSVAYGFACIIRSGKEYQTGIDGVLVLTVLMTVVGIGIQFINSKIRVDFLCIAIGNALLYSRCYKIVLQLDAVTHLLNRRCYDAALGNIGSRAVIIAFDVNLFKQINDTYGHSVGDICLKQIGKLIHEIYGKYGSCYRIGGDEFCVILDERLDDLQKLNEHFLAALKRLQAQDKRIPSVSIGYAYYDPDSSHIQEAIETADAMMYKNKSAF